MKTPRGIKRILHFQNHIRRDKKSFIVYTVLRILVILVLVRCILTGNYEGAGLCILSLALFLFPAFFEERFHVDIPTPFEITIYLFIFAAEIMGEIGHYYTRIPIWDTMLHTLNGFLCAAIGISLIYVIDQRSEHIDLSPFYLAVVAFCFSMTIGVIWEFIEFGADSLLKIDMQKDFIVQEINTVSLDMTRSQAVQHVTGITRTLIETADGDRFVISGGYLDIGLIDTMKDLFVNFIGAVIYSVFGYIYLKNSGGTKAKKNIAGRLMLTIDNEQPEAVLKEASADALARQPKTEEGRVGE